MRQRKAAKRRQEKQAQAEARRAAREHAKQLAAAATAARQERAERAAKALEAKGVDATGDALWTQKQKELQKAAAQRAEADQKSALQGLLKQPRPRELLAQWLLTVHSANASDLAQAIGVDKDVRKSRRMATRCLRFAHLQPVCRT